MPCFVQGDWRRPVRRAQYADADGEPLVGLSTNCKLIGFLFFLLDLFNVFFLNDLLKFLWNVLMIFVFFGDIL